MARRRVAEARASRDAEASAIFAELRVVEGGPRRDLLESPRFRALLAAEPPLAALRDPSRDARPTGRRFPRSIAPHSATKATRSRASPASSVRASWYEPELSFVAEEDGVLLGHVMNTWNSAREAAHRASCSSRRSASCPSTRDAATDPRSSAPRSTRFVPRGEPLLLVEGNPKYYGRFGFVRADELGLLPPPEALYDWAFQVAVLDPNADCCRRGASSTRSRSGTERARARGAERCGAF